MLTETVEQQQKTQAIRFVVHGRPVPKARPRMAMRGRTAYVYKDEKTREYERLVGFIAKQACKRPLKGPVQVNIRLFSMNDFDVDNVAKSVLDGMNKICFKDDNQVTALYVSKTKVRTEKEERAEVEVRPLVN
ncbi:hypothetical protein GCM10010965_27520 [Caldalkalibacillus thermarum]|uniref:RusA family crossover junction endodeoxyribonuclease n=1 Tax=Caldalkalibacillus thermarum TaxID=296745 RepID=UPI00166BDDEE|nr:RusA family crossover junction endodeoxyribonuclease [Caldalkalibacillus thermarum]GGK33175.1 hypothetical protein GCM10010965_27520 [Caldalkalibacillus thermarum]